MWEKHIFIIRLRFNNTIQNECSRETKDLQQITKYLKKIQRIQNSKGPFFFANDQAIF